MLASLSISYPGGRDKMLRKREVYELLVEVMNGEN